MMTNNLYSVIVSLRKLEIVIFFTYEHANLDASSTFKFKFHVVAPSDFAAEIHVVD